MLRPATAMWLILCIAIASGWCVGECGLMHSPQHLFARWSFFLPPGAWPWKTTLIVYHDAPSLNVGPPMDPGFKYNTAVLLWYRSLRCQSYHRALGFDCDDVPNLEIIRTRNMVLRGRAYVLRMPDWAAWAMWTPFFMAWVRALRRRQLARRGYCPVCSYDLTGNVSGCCPECGTAIPSRWRAALRFVPQGHS